MFDCVAEISLCQTKTAWHTEILVEEKIQRADGIVRPLKGNQVLV